MRELTPTVESRGEIYHLVAWNMTSKEAWDCDEKYKAKGYATSWRVIGEDYLNMNSNENAIYVRIKRTYTDSSHNFIKLKKADKWAIKSKAHPGRFYISWFNIDPKYEKEGVYCSNCGNVESNEFDDLMGCCGSCGGIFGPDEEFIEEELEPVSDEEIRKWCSGA